VTVISEQAVLDIRPSTPTIGAEVRGVDLREPLSERTRDAIWRAFQAHEVLVFPGQRLGPVEQVNFASSLGTIAEPSSVEAPLDGHPAVLQFDSAKAPRDNRVDYDTGRVAGWHADITFARRPPAAAVFNVRELPAGGGGDTMFASTRAAYDRLSPALQTFVDGLHAIHQPSKGIRATLARKGPGAWDGAVVNADDAFIHPVVRVNPETGRSSLFINPAFTTQIVELSHHESTDLLALLYDLVAQAENTVRYQWSEGDVALWDNQTVWHRRVTDYPAGARRVAERVLLAGTQPVGRSGATGAELAN
jgi:alpha-ketoglutarate-dependent taurine dioxygenase